MTRKPDVLTLLRKEMGKDAAAILNKVDEMLKEGVNRASIEKAIARDLCAHAKKEMLIIAERLVPHRVCP